MFEEEENNKCTLGSGREKLKMFADEIFHQFLEREF